MKVLIIDYNTGNIGSILNMLRKVGVSAEISNSPDKIQEADKLILPGVGHFDFGMRNLRESGVIPSLTNAVLKEKKPILGICLGAQLMTQSSEEGIEEGLGWFNAVTKKFNFDKEINKKIPHMGWTDVFCEKESKLFANMHVNPRFYFIHSFHMQALDYNDVLLTSDYGYKFAAGLERDNIAGVQFHPEKSHKFGKKLLENFINAF